MTTKKFVLAEIDKNPFQVRSGVDPVYLAELAGDIERNGLLQTPVGRLVDGRVQLAFGHNRLEAFRLLAERFSEFEQMSADGYSEFEQMPVEVRELSDEQMALLAWSENEVRQPLNAVERAKAVERMIAAFGWSQQEAGDRLGMARSTVANMLRLLKLPGHVLESLKVENLSVRQAMALLPVYDLGAQDFEWLHSEESRRSFLRNAILGQISSDVIRYRVEEFMGELERRKARAAAAEESEKEDIRPNPPSSPALPPEGEGSNGPEKDKLRMLLTPAMDYARTQQYVTVPQLQRELRVSWRTAHDLMQEMRKWDVIGDMDGSSMRHKVLVGRYAVADSPAEDPRIEDDPLIEDDPGEEEASGLVKDQPLQEEGEPVSELLDQPSEWDYLSDELQGEIVNYQKRITELEAERDQLRKLCWTAVSALRSYQYGNSSTELAEEVADKLQEVIG